MSDALMDLIAVNDDQHLVYSEEERKQAFNRLHKLLQLPKEYMELGRVLHLVLSMAYEELEETEEREGGSTHLWYCALDKIEEYLQTGFPEHYQKEIVKVLYDFCRKYLGLTIVD